MSLDRHLAPRRRQVQQGSAMWGDTTSLGDVVSYFVGQDTKEGFSAVGRNVSVLKESDERLDKENLEQERPRPRPPARGRWPPAGGRRPGWWAGVVGHLLPRTARPGGGTEGGPGLLAPPAPAGWQPRHRGEAKGDYRTFHVRWLRATCHVFYGP